jgi:hypothetical protein
VSGHCEGAGPHQKEVTIDGLHAGTVGTQATFEIFVPIYQKKTGQYITGYLG